MACFEQSNSTGEAAMEDVCVCVVGAGRLSSRRIYPYLAPAGGRLVGVCDLERQKAERNARLYGGNVYTEMEAMLEAEEPDACIVCVGPAGHAQLAPVAMERGIPVYTEKPPALDAASALEVARLSRRSGVLCTTAFKKRYNTAYNRAREWLAGFDAADRYSISIDYASAQYEAASGPGSFLLDFAIHAIDLIGYLFGDVEQAFAFSRGADAYAVGLKFACGAVGSMNLTCGRSFGVPTEEVEITVRGGNFMTVHNSSVWRITEGQKPVEWREPPTFISAGDSGRETGHLAELEDFFAAVREGRTTRSNILESYKSMVLYEAIRDSAAEGRPVAVEYAEP
jgi:predicted dehydrogenase